ncbi:ATP-binding cassette domain-containing protein, partial [Paenibacillus tyrfis]|uniref:ATP-binding cassette domain-containing protein n=1 Tax=Paenibacillus tyrfis TaxID=1501230 RepID=UPI002646C1F5
QIEKKIKGNIILDNISLSLEKGQIYGFWGRNGSGKTMLFRAISGLIKVDHGQIIVFGKTLHKEISFPESVGVIIESPSFWNDYTGYNNLKVLASIKKLISDEEIKDALTRVGLDPKDSRSVRKYSLGMKQRLGIAQAIMEKPDLIILDEPTNALDDDGIEQIRTILLEEKKRGATILIASHNKDDLRILADYSYRMSEGKLYQTGLGEGAQDEKK